MKKPSVVFIMSFLSVWTCLPGGTVSPEKSIYSLGGDYKGNFVWGGAMSLCWNELTGHILREKLKLKTKDADALEITELFNRADFTRDDLNPESYYIKSGFGPQTLDLINQDVKAKFPGKSLADLDLPLGEQDIISYAYFLKAVEYVAQFSEGFIVFQGARVKGFYADGARQKNNIRVLKYWNDDKFIIALRLKDPTDEIILAKGFVMTRPDEVVRDLNQYHWNDESMGGDDTFVMPKLHLDHSRRYEEMIGQALANERFEEYFIAEMLENIKFDMDHKGARVESEALIAPARAALGLKHKRFILDRPFWVIMKRQDRPRPYFILGVNNPDVMEKE